MKRAAYYFHNIISAAGGYLWKYKSDLIVQEGESPAERTPVRVQPPGTPTVGGAFLKAFEAIQDPVYPKAALDTQAWSWSKASWLPADGSTGFTSIRIPEKISIIVWMFSMVIRKRGTGKIELTLTTTILKVLSRF